MNKKIKWNTGTPTPNSGNILSIADTRDGRFIFVGTVGWYDYMYDTRTKIALCYVHEIVKWCKIYDVIDMIADEDQNALKCD